MESADIHMKHRCMWLSVICGLSAYTWYCCPLFVLFPDVIFTPYTFTPSVSNGVIFVCYLIWDTHKMLTDRRLYRSDLIIHHGIAFIISGSCTYYIPTQMSQYLVMESISLMNYTLRDLPNILKIYRTFVITCIRIPLTLWYYFVYNPYYTIPFIITTTTVNGVLWMRFIYNLCLFFIVYDIFLLYKIHKPRKIKQ